MKVVKKVQLFSSFHNGDYGLKILVIHCKEKDGDWYMYNCKSFKLDKSNAVRIGKTAAKPYLSIMRSGLSLVRKVLW